MKKLRRRADLPAAFDLQKYDFLKDANSLDWAAVLSARLWVHHLVAARDADRDWPAQHQVDDELQRCFNENREDLLAYSEKCIGTPTLRASLGDLLDSIRGNLWQRDHLQFGVVGSLSVLTAGGIGETVRRLPKDYRKALTAIRDRERALRSPAEEIPELSSTEQTLLRTPLFRALDPTQGTVPRWRALVVDLDAVDDELKSAFATWLADIRTSDEVRESGAIPDPKKWSKWISNRVVPYIDLQHWAAAHDCEITLSLLRETLFPGCSISDDKVRKTTKEHAEDWLTQRMLLTLVRLARNEGLLHEDSEENGAQ